MSTVNNTETTTSSADGGAGVEPWGTLEELLLACAVNRHGADSWDSIAKELQNRTGLTKTDENENENDDNRVFFTALNCKEKYGDLKRRFNLDGTGSGDGLVDAGIETDDGRDELKWMADALRKLRVEELKREVQRRDASIVSLELKVKRLEEEREKTLKTMVDDIEGGADLINGNGSRSRYLAGSGDDGGSDEIDDDDRSFNESNSTSQKDNNDDESNRDPAADEVEGETGLKTEPVSDSKTEPDRIHEIYVDGPGRDRSYSGGLGILEAETSAASRLGESNELRDSVSESKGEVKGAAKQNNSDVQSSASLSKRKRRGWRGGGGGGGAGSSSGDEVGAEELSPANRLIGVKSRPLIGFLESLRSHKHGSVFERRLPSQETEKYRNLILQHMDLDTIQSKLDRGIYSDSHMIFYRDLLLVFTNAILFYPKSSAEHIAARELRKLVKQEITRKTRTPKPFKPEPELHLLDSIVKKPRSATTTIICRRRATTPPKALPLDDQVEEKKDNGLEQKPKAQTKVQPQLNDNGDHKVKEKGSVTMPKKLTREKPPTMVNNIKKTSTTNNNKKHKNKEVKQDDHSNDSQQESDSKKEKQAKATSPATKKQGVANFLRRMKQNSPAREAEEEDETESKKNGGGAVGDTRSKEKEKVDNKKAGMVRRTSGRMQGKDQEKEMGKRVAGRPPKRKAAKGATESPVAATKRKREGDSGGSGGRQKKKSRK
ncbi:hypothetical protein Droror1_Dr00001564 [Drosera rotundifolia]